MHHRSHSAVFAANLLTDIDKQNSTGKYNTQTKYEYNPQKSKQCKIQQNNTTPVQSPLMTLGQETRWPYSTALPKPTQGSTVEIVRLSANKIHSKFACNYNVQGRC